jgi:hypothetical protein
MDSRRRSSARNPDQPGTIKVTAGSDNITGGRF